jgi:hypothetical protein
MIGLGRSSLKTPSRDRQKGREQIPNLNAGYKYTFRSPDGNERWNEFDDTGHGKAVKSRASSYSRGGDDVSSAQPDYKTEILECCNESRI